MQHHNSGPHNGNSQKAVTETMYYRFLNTGYGGYRHFEWAGCLHCGETYVQIITVGVLSGANGKFETEVVSTRQVSTEKEPVVYVRGGRVSSGGGGYTGRHGGTEEPPSNLRIWFRGERRNVKSRHQRMSEINSFLSFPSMSPQRGYTALYDSRYWTKAEWTRVATDEDTWGSCSRVSTSGQTFLTHRP
ncbi:hypothetical protein C8R47DRAFT_1083730 [Mycena vitilis]|nr:hypothetical protein C8R47DRAFT_1083730 [Mycena vitilis]